MVYNQYYLKFLLNRLKRHPVDNLLIPTAEYPICVHQVFKITHDKVNKLCIALSGWLSQNLSRYS